MKLHPKIQELRNKVGHIAIHRFIPSRKTNSESIAKSSPVVKDKESSDEREIQQYFAVWGVVDDYRTRPIRGCFKKSIEERGPSSKAPGKIIVLDQHRQHMPVCVPTEIKEDEIGLFARYTPDKIQRNDDLIVQIKSGTINNGSYGFEYLWDKMEYDEKDECIDMHEVILHELSPVTFGSQRETFVVRNSSGLYVPGTDELIEDTESFIKKLPRNLHLELRSLINRHISLANMQPLDDENEKALKKRKPNKGVIDYDYLTKKLKEK